MKKNIFLLCFLSLLSSISIGQKLTISDLSKLKGMSLNNAETLLSQKNFDFKEVRESDDNGKDYAFGFNLDKYGDKADEYLILSFNVNEPKPLMVWYQLSKEGWLKLKNALSALSYKKVKTETESDGSLSTEYTNSKLTFHFNSGKSSEAVNNGALVYTLNLQSN